MQFTQVVCVLPEEWVVCKRLMLKATASSKLANAMNKYLNPS